MAFVITQSLRSLLMRFLAPFFSTPYFSSVIKSHLALADFLIDECNSFQLASNQPIGVLIIIFPDPPTP